MKVNISKILKTTALVSILSCSLTACLNDSNSTNSNKQSPESHNSSDVSNVNSKTYTVLSEQSYVPFIMNDGNGTTSGFEHDILMAIAEKEGLSLTFKSHLWDYLFTALANGEADIISSGLTINEERKKSMNFTNPHIETETALLTRDNQIKSFTDIKGKKVVIQKGTLQKDIAISFGVKPENINERDTTWNSFREVLVKNGDVVLGDKIVMNYYKKQYPNEKFNVVLDPNSEKEQLGFAVQKNNVELLNKLNAGLLKIKNDGTYDKIYNQWFSK